MAVGFLSFQLFLDQGERNEWFDSKFIILLLILAVTTLVAFVIRELMADEPILDLGVYADRNFAAGSFIMLIVMIGFFSSMVAAGPLHPEGARLRRLDLGAGAGAGRGWQPVLTAAGGRLITRMDQRWLLALGCC
jgi:DHA2 family multidrug resistance protein